MGRSILGCWGEGVDPWQIRGRGVGESGGGILGSREVEEEPEARLRP